MIRSRKEYLDYLEADRLALGRSGSIRTLFVVDPIWAFQRLLHKVEYYTNCKPGLIYKPYLFYLKFKFNQYKLLLGFTIPPNVLGPGVEATALVPSIGRLPGLDGKTKMSKSLGNAIALSSTPDEIRAAVRKIYTDPRHLRVEDPGHLDGNVAFTYLDAFNADPAGLAELKARYLQGGVADSAVKARLEACLQELLAPIRARRQTLEKDRGYVLEQLPRGTSLARDVAAKTADEVKEALGLRYFDGGEI